jgi:mannose-1-phosphate guanylyltransferase
MAKLKALLLAAGLGTRLRPLTDVLPKCLMPVCGRPLLGYWLLLLRDAGITEIVVNCHHHGELVERFISRSPFASIVTLVREPELLGTGGTLLHNRELLAGGPILVAHADNLSLFDPQHFLNAHRTRPDVAELTMMTFDSDAPQDCGIVERDERGLVICFHEKVATPPGNRANAAVYIVESAVLELLDSFGKTVIDFSTEVVPRFLGRISTFHNDVYHRDIGTLDSLLRAQFEYPGAASMFRQCVTREDPWYGLLDRDSGSLAQEFKQSLDQALNIVHGSH